MYRGSTNKFVNDYPNDYHKPRPRRSQRGRSGVAIVDRGDTSVKDSRNLPFPDLSRKDAAPGVFGLRWTPEVGCSGYFLYEIHEMLPRPVSGAPGRS